MQGLEVAWFGLDPEKRQRVLAAPQPWPAEHLPRQPSRGRLVLLVLIWVSLTAPLFGATRSPKQRVVPHWARFEQAFVSTIDYTNALQEANLRAVFTSPLGETRTVDGFWDGGRAWRVRFCPDTPGQWTFTTFCSDARNFGLDGRTGQFLCTAPMGDSVFQRHGLVRVARDHRHFEHEDGTPFFWLGDVAWSGARLSTAKDWARYVTIRSSQAFNVALWSVAPDEDFEHESALTGFPDRIGINPAFFRRLDAKLETLSREGILSAILPWSEPVGGVNAKSLPDDQLALLFRYLVSRWGADPVTWVVDVGSDAATKEADRWRRIGSAVFTNSFHAPVIVFPVKGPALPDQFRNQPWIDALGVDAAAVPGEASGKIPGTPRSEEGLAGQSPPIILFAPRENGVARPSDKRFSADDVRHAVYQNLFLTPPAGVSYAAQGVVNWDATTDPKSDATMGNGMPMWEKALFLPAAKQMRPLANLMNSIDFWHLHSQPEAVPGQSEQPATENHVVAASTSTKDLTLIYLPQPNPVDVYLQAMPASPLISWLEPRQGSTRSAVAVVSGTTCQFPPPGPGDWVLLIRSGK